MNLEALSEYRFRRVEQSYTHKDTILYALGIGLGSNPLDPVDLTYVYEEGLKAVPSFCNVLAHPGFWVADPALAIDWKRLLHVEQRFEMHETLPPSGTVAGEYRVASVQDLGPDKGALLQLEKKLSDARENCVIATVTSVYLLRGDGGQGGFGDALAPLASLPDKTPDAGIEIASLPQSALLYRLNGDWNPIHASPQIASKAGFEQPILQGLCTLGFAMTALIRRFLHNNPERLKSLAVRFSRPAFPGQIFRSDFFINNSTIQFRTIASARGETVLDRGIAVIND